jgi:hypothetical protein
LAARPAPPSTLSLLGLIRPLAKVERIWLRQRAAGQPLPPLYGGAGDDTDFAEIRAQDAEEEVAQLRGEWQQADQAVAGLPFDHAVVAAPARTRHTVVAAPEPEWSPWARPPRRRWRGRLGIQSKLLAMLLAVSVVSVLVTGFFGYRSGSQALVDAEYEQLTSVRDARTREVNALFAVLRRSVLLNSANATRRSP